MSARLYVIPGSHPSMTARLMLEAKGIAYKRMDLIPVMSKGILRAAGFPGVVVPALKIDGRKIQGSRPLALALEDMVAEPPLYPRDPAELAKLQEAERWGDEELQQIARRIIWWVLKHDRTGMDTVMEGARVGVPVKMAVAVAGPVAALAARFNGSTDEAVKADLAQLPVTLDRIDGLIADGVLGATPPNAADYQIAPSLRLMMTLDDLRPLIEDRPAGQLALRVAPDFPGRIPASLPKDWLPG